MEKNTKLNLRNMLGMKIFKENEDNIELYRIVGIRGSKIKVRNEADNSISLNDINDFEGFTPLGSDGYFTANVVTISDRLHKQEEKDVIVTVNKTLELENGITFPYAICRQSITDIFYNLLCSDESQQIVGLSVNRDDCPTNFDIGLMLACNEIKYSEHCSFYREDTLEDILSMINTRKFDMVLSDLYTGHCKYSNNPKASMKREDIDRVLAELKDLKCKSQKEVEEARVRFLGKKGEITALFDEFRTVDKDMKREFGRTLNELKNLAQETIDRLRDSVGEQAAAEGPQQDLTMPGDPLELGSRHPVSIVRQEIVDIFRKFGYDVAEGPELEDDYHVFEALNFPPNHPARDMQDTFFVSTGHPNPLLLRTHTSSVQVRTMERMKTPPIRVICPGRVFPARTASSTRWRVSTSTRT